MATLDFATPSPCNLGQKATYRLGESAATALGYNPGDELGPVVERLGGEVIFQSLSELEYSSSGSIEVLDEGKFKIFLAAHTSELRDRYTIAHEIGHYVLHFLFPRKNGTNISNLRAARYGSGLAEYEANWFAAGFLMPEEAFKAAHDEFGGDTGSIARRFRVSEQACEVRAKVLKLA